MDVFFRIKALSDLGVKIHLHCFEYGRGMPSELAELTHEIHYYRRKKSLRDVFNKLPFIVKSRGSEQFIQRLTADRHPILFEGLHCCYFLNDKRIRNRKRFVRTHNIEHEYYHDLAINSRGIRKNFFAREARKLKAFEPMLKFADHLFCIKESDASHFKMYNENVTLLPASLPTLEITRQQQTEPYCLFHGNLSVTENEVAVNWLIDKVFSPIQMAGKFMVAGKNPSQELINTCQESSIQLVLNPTEDHMDELIQKARVHVFYTPQASGVKLKLLNAMNSSGHIIANHKMIYGTNLGAYCELAMSKEEFQHQVEQLLRIELDTIKFNERISFLKEHYDTKKNLGLLLELIGER